MTHRLTRHPTLAAVITCTLALPAGHALGAGATPQPPAAEAGNASDTDLDTRLRDMLTGDEAAEQNAVDQLRSTQEMVRAADRLMRKARGEDVPPIQEAWMDDPLVAVANLMDDASKHLDAGKTDPSVQQTEQEAVDKLDHLIELMEQMCQSCSGGGSGMGMANGNAPAQDSTLSPGPGGMGELIDPRDGSADWTALPDAERDRILQSHTEGFPTGFEDVLGEYYSKLASPDADADAPGPTEQDTP